MRVWLVVAAVVSGLLDVGLVGSGPPAGLALSLLLDAALILLPRYPRVVGVLAVGVTAAMLLGPVSLVGSLSPVTVARAAPLVIVWLVANSDRRFAFAVTAVLAVLGARPWAPSWEVTPFAVLATVGPAVVTLYLVARADLLASLRDRAERAEREQRLLAERARAQERRRLAEDMHDVVTHRLSLIVLQAGALGVSAPEVRAAAEDIRTAGTQALEELRDLVGVLRTTDDRPVAEREPVQIPHPATLTTGPDDVDLDVDGEPADVSPTVARTAYRVVQEALTNVRKHAPGAAVHVRLRYHPDRVRVTVTNTAATAAPDPALAGTGSGTGLRGLEQRVGLVGGELTTGPTSGGGYRVDATLPGYVPA